MIVSKHKNKIKITQLNDEINTELINNEEYTIDDKSLVLNSFIDFILEL